VLDSRGGQGGLLYEKYTRQREIIHVRYEPSKTSDAGHGGHNAAWKYPETPFESPDLLHEVLGPPSE
jgi:hypothetical protein